MTKLGKYIILGIILLLIVGVAVTKITVKEKLSLNASEQECKKADFWMLYDNPIERIVVGWLGKTAVIEKNNSAEDKNVLLIKAYTIFRIPIGKSAVQCGGSSYKIPQTQSAIEQAINKAQYCEIKSDCVQVQSECPFGCHTFVNKNEAERIQTFIDSYESKCAYICVELAGYDCINNKCDVILPDRGISREILYENCAQEIPREKIDDTALNQFEKTVTVWWWDNGIQDNVELKLPYEPETNFAGCSESVKNLLRHIQETAGNESKDNL